MSFSTHLQKLVDKKETVIEIERFNHKMLNMIEINSIFDVTSEICQEMLSELMFPQIYNKNDLLELKKISTDIDHISGTIDFITKIYDLIVSRIDHLLKLINNIYDKGKLLTPGIEHQISKILDEIDNISSGSIHLGKNFFINVIQKIKIRVNLETNAELTIDLLDTTIEGLNMKPSNYKNIEWIKASTEKARATIVLQKQKLKWKYDTIELIKVNMKNTIINYNKEFQVWKDRKLEEIENKVKCLKSKVDFMESMLNNNKYL